MGVTIDGIPVGDLPDLGGVTDASSFVAEYAGTGRHGAIALRNYVNATRPASVKDYPFYAKGDGTTDDTAAIQAAVTACANGPLYVPPGTYKITTALSIPGSIAMRGAGKTLSVLSLAANGMTGLNITGTAPVTVEALQISPASGITGTTGIKMSGVENAESTFRDLQFNGLDKCIDTETASTWTIDNCDFVMFTTYGLQVRNTVRPDSGDSFLSNCFFLAASTSVSACIQQLSSGGLKITNSKFLSGFYGYALVLEAGAVTGDLMISNSSFEGQATGAAISLQQQAGGGNSFHSAVITGCQINGSLVGVQVSTIPGAGWLTGLVISGCEIYAPTSGRAFDLNGVNGFNVSGCDVYSLGTGVTAAVIGTHSSNGMIGPINAVGTGFSTYATNAGFQVIIEPSTQRGSGSAATTTGYGALWQGPATPVVFAPPFYSAPTVSCAPTALGGSVSVVPTSITASGFTPVVIGDANAVTVPFAWMALGN